MLRLLPLLLALNASAADTVTLKTLRTLPGGVPDEALTVVATQSGSSLNLWSIVTGKQLGHFEIPVIPKKNSEDYDQFTIHSVRPDLKLILVSTEHGYADKKYHYEKTVTHFYLVSTDDGTVKKLWSLEGPCLDGNSLTCTGLGRFAHGSFIDANEVVLFARRQYRGSTRVGWVSLLFSLDGRKLFENEPVYEGNVLVKGSVKDHAVGKRTPTITTDAQSCSVKIDGKQVSFLDECSEGDYPWVTFDGKAIYGNGDEFKAWDLATGALTTRLGAKAPEGFTISWTPSPDGRVVLALIMNRDRPEATVIQIWSMATRKLKATASVPDSKYIYRLRTNGRLAMYSKNEMKDGEFVRSFSVIVDLGLEDGPAVSAAAPAAAKLDVDELPTASLKADPDAFAIVIGVEKYRQAGVPAVDYASRDAKTMAAYLGAMGFDAKNVAVLTDAQAGKVDFDKHFGKWLKNRVGPKSRVFVYYAGHGAPNPTTGAGYLMPYEADPSYLDETAYPVSQLYAELAKLPTKDVTVVLDACFSGQGERSLIAKGTRPLVAMQKTRGPENAAVIAAASGSQISASDHEARHGLLTYHLLAGLHGGADDNGDGKITTAELFKYAGPAVERAAKLQNVEQTPTVSGENGLAGARIWTTLKKP